MFHWHFLLIGDLIIGLGEYLGNEIMAFGLGIRFVIELEL
jgi:hypothetical protein